ncbi:MAG: hypothetical protein AAB758_03050 [Patescibacteria group bacterium]
MAGKKKSIPTELEGVAFEEDVNAIQEQVERCYSKDRYEDFQEAVEKITERFLKGKVGWAVFIWLITLIASMLAQKFFAIF